MVKLDDVAKRAQVSAMTVSRYINQSGQVSDKTAARIRQAILDLDYHPNRIAQSLVTKRTNTIALVIASITNPYYPDLVLGVEDEAYRHNASVILCNVEGKSTVQHFSHILMEKGVDGIIFSHLNLCRKDIQWLLDHNIQVSLIDNEPELLFENIFNVISNDYEAAACVAKHLLELDHRNIALIHGAHSASNRSDLEFEETYQFNIWRKRTRGFIDTLERCGVTLAPEKIVLGNGSPRAGVTGGFVAMCQLLNLPDRPTAVYCENDLMAIGAFKALNKAGVKIGQEVSVIGHDGLSICQSLYPELTTMVQPKYEIGRIAARQLLVPDMDARIYISAELSIGGSTGFI